MIDPQIYTRVISLLRAMLVNEPDDYTADAVTHWMTWRQEAAELLSHLPPEQD